MSSNSYSARLSTDRLPRCLVTGSACTLYAVGVFLIASMPFALGLRLTACLAWSVASCYELRPYWRSYRTYAEICVLAGGDVRLKTRHLEWVSGRLRGGSVLLRRVAWLCIKTQDGCQFAELILASGQSSREWRRLQLIWRHIRAAD